MKRRGERTAAMCAQELLALTYAPNEPLLSEIERGERLLNLRRIGITLCLQGSTLGTQGGKLRPPARYLGLEFFDLLSGRDRLWYR